MSMREGLADFDDLAGALIGAEIDGGANGGGAEVVSLLHGAEEHLVEAIGEGEQLVVIHLHDERDFVGVLARDGAEHAESGSHSVAPTLDSQLDDVAAVEVIGIFREAGAAGMLDALVDGQDREIAGSAEAAVGEQALQIGEHADVAVGRRVDTADKIGAGKMQALLGDFWGLESQEGFGLCTEIGFNLSGSQRCSHFSLLNLSAAAKSAIVL